MVRNILGKLWSIKNGVAKLTPSRAVLGKMTPVFGMLVIGVVCYFWGRLGMQTARTQTREEILRKVQQVEDKGDYSKRVVAYIYGNIPVTREELGEFLIARFGAERLPFMIDRHLVELDCKARGIVVTDQMVEAQLDKDLKAYNANMTRKDFVNQILKRFNKTLYEWKEDTVRPKLMLAQLVGPEIQVTEEDVQKGFEGRYGPKVDCRMIVLQDTPQKFKIWEQVREDEAEFQRAATKINLPQLAASGGKVPPIHKHFGDERIEKAAFNLRKGEVSPLIEMSDHTVIILKCDQHIPPDLTKRIETERAALYEEIRGLKLTQRIWEKMAEMRKAANPNLLLRNENRQEDVERAVREEISGTAAPPPQPANKVGG
jgi:hypothetical protein